MTTLIQDLKFALRMLAKVDRRRREISSGRRPRSTLVSRFPGLPQAGRRFHGHDLLRPQSGRNRLSRECRPHHHGLCAQQFLHDAGHSSRVGAAHRSRRRRCAEIRHGRGARTQLLDAAFRRRPKRDWDERHFGRASGYGDWCRARRVYRPLHDCGARRLRSHRDEG